MERAWRCRLGHVPHTPYASVKNKGVGKSTSCISSLRINRTKAKLECTKHSIKLNTKLLEVKHASQTDEAALTSKIP